MTDPAQSSSPAASIPARDEGWLPPSLPHDEAPQEQTLASRIVGLVLAFLVGLAYGAIGTVAHAWAPSILGVAIPVGLLLSILGIAMLLLGLRIVLGSRLAATAAAVGIMLMLVLLLTESAGGSVLIPQSVAGLVWTFSPGLIAVLVIAWPKLPEPRRAVSATSVATPAPAEVDPTSQA
ncbi:hypothetical protein KXS11_02940 [Plantibacter flavus]|uniref:DUF6113 family protein n=1 Tax=Plantibacter flavus TaxID=150123 RepID=UPI003F13F213